MLKSHSLTLTLSHSHTLSICHSLTLDMLNNFCFHLYSQNSSVYCRKLQCFFFDIITRSCEHRAGSQLIKKNTKTHQAIVGENVVVDIETGVGQHAHLPDLLLAVDISSKEVLEPVEISYLKTMV